jgi:DNA replication protein DnaC
LQDKEEYKIDTESTADNDVAPAIVRRQSNILVTGTPGVGKTSLAKLLLE